MHSFWDDYNNHKGIHALPCLRFEQKISKPLPVSMPLNPTTLGEHIRKRRMELRLFQKDVAAIFNVSEDCITYWENNRSEPQIQYYPPIFGFLGYCPFELDASTFAGKIKAYRYLNGLTQKRFAKLMNLDPATVGRWENGRGQGAKKELVEAFLANGNSAINQPNGNIGC